MAKKKIVRHGTWTGTEKQWERIAKQNKERALRAYETARKRQIEDTEREKRQLQEKRSSIKNKLSRLSSHVYKTKSGGVGDYEDPKYKEKEIKLRKRLLDVDRELNEVKEDLRSLKGKSKPVSPKEETPSYWDIATNKINEIMGTLGTFQTKWEQEKARVVTDLLSGLLGGLADVSKLWDILPQLEREIIEFITNNYETYDGDMIGSGKDGKVMTDRSWNKILELVGVRNTEFTEYVQYEE